EGLHGRCAGVPAGRGAQDRACHSPGAARQSRGALEYHRYRPSPAGFGRNTTKCVMVKFTTKLTRIAIALAAQTGMSLAANTTVAVVAITATMPEPTKPA